MSSRFFAGSMVGNRYRNRCIFYTFGIRSQRSPVPHEEVVKTDGERPSRLHGAQTKTAFADKNSNA